MLGFKLELPQRDDGITKKTRPIYLDMQVEETVTLDTCSFLTTPRPLPQ
jgi:hypothetical protein